MLFKLRVPFSLDEPPRPGEVSGPCNWVVSFGEPPLGSFGESLDGPSSELDQCPSAYCLIELSSTGTLLLYECSRGWYCTLLKNCSYIGAFNTNLSGPSKWHGAVEGLLIEHARKR